MFLSLWLALVYQQCSNYIMRIWNEPTEEYGFNYWRKRKEFLKFFIRISEQTSRLLDAPSVTVWIVTWFSYQSGSTCDRLHIDFIYNWPTFHLQADFSGFQVHPISFCSIRIPHQNIFHLAPFPLCIQTNANIRSNDLFLVFNHFPDIARCVCISFGGSHPWRIAWSDQIFVRCAFAFMEHRNKTLFGRSEWKYGRFIGNEFLLFHPTIDFEREFLL